MYVKGGAYEAAALGKKLSIRLFMCALFVLKCLPDGRAPNSLCPGWFIFDDVTSPPVQSISIDIVQFVAALT